MLEASSKSRFKLSNIVTVLFILIYKILLDISYIDILYPNYRYTGFELDYSFLTIIVGYMMFIIILGVMPKKLIRPSDIVLFLLILIACIPVLTVYSFGGEDFTFTLVHVMFWSTICVVLKIVPHIKINRPSQKVRKRVFWFLLIFFIGYCLITIISTFGIAINLDFINVYKQRSLYKQAHIPFSGYFFTWAANVVLPAGLLYLILTKRYLWCIPVLYAQFLLFTATGMKTMLFVLLFTLGAYLLSKFKNKLTIVSGIFTAAVVVTIYLYNSFSMIMPYSLFTRRVLLLPAHLSYKYYEFFSGNGLLKLAHSSFDMLTKYRYDIPPSLIIGRTFSHAETFANNGVVADGFMNFGYWGVLVWAAVIVLLLIVMDMVTDEKNYIFALAAFSAQSITLTNSALFTSFLTHGIILSLIVVYFMPDLERKEKKKRIKPIDVVSVSNKT